MKFHLISQKLWSADKGFKSGYLEIDNWNDYSFVTAFNLSVADKNGKIHNLGALKIGFKGQDTSQSTFRFLEKIFDQLPPEFFSLGCDEMYYRNLSELPQDFRNDILKSLNDMVYDKSYVKLALDESVFSVSLLRGVSLTSINGQFTRVLNGNPPLTNFEFEYKRIQEEKVAGIDLLFQVKANSKPTTNIHALIGRNGIGKTTLLNGMINAIIKRDVDSGLFFDREIPGDSIIDKQYFSSLISVSFSAFDPFDPPEEQPDPSKGTCYYYIGLKNLASNRTHELKSLANLHKEFVQSLNICLAQDLRRERWAKAVQILESDENFSSMNLKSLLNYSGTELTERATSRIERMSSGHTIVLLIVTKLVAKVEEKTLVLIDEPESHLHPPLLSAFIRSLSDLLHDRNGVAIIATHSPVVIQEVPKSCVWKIFRSRLQMESIRPEEETFGENVGTLTREIFGLEVGKSGFHNVLRESVMNGDSFNEILEEFDNQLGLEAKSILRSLVNLRDRDQ